MGEPKNGPTNGNLLTSTVTLASLPQQGPCPPFTTGTIQYAYDSLDHLTQEQSQRNIVVPGFGNTIANYTNASASDAADNLTQLRGVTFSGNANNQVTGDSNGAAYGYDADGDATTEAGAHLQYDEAGHLTAYDDNANNVHFTFGYRPDGLRAWKTYPGGPVNYFLYNGDQLTAEINASSGLSTRLYGWGVAGLEEVDSPLDLNQGSTFYSFDPQGNRVNRFGGAAILDLSCYDAFGFLVGDYSYAAIGQSAFDWDPVGWGGQWGAYSDVPGYAATPASAPGGGAPGSAGLILLTHRYYSPYIGRFLTRDPIGQEGGVNVYAYTRNNPANRIDPSGYSEDSLTASFRAALRSPQGLREAIEIFNDLATTSGAKGMMYTACAALLLKDPRVKEAFIDSCARFELTHSDPFYHNDHGGVKCGFHADNFLYQIHSTLPEFDMSLARKFEMVGDKGGDIILADGTHYRSHCYIEIGDMIIDSLNRGRPEKKAVWEKRFLTPKEHWYLPWHRSFDDYYKAADMGHSVGIDN